MWTYSSSTSIASSDMHVRNQLQSVTGVADDVEWWLSGVEWSGGWT
jgi:hypothetical protein